MDERPKPPRPNPLAALQKLAEAQPTPRAFQRNRQLAEALLSVATPPAFSQYTTLMEAVRKAAAPPVLPKTHLEQVRQTSAPSVLAQNQQLLETLRSAATRRGLQQSQVEAMKRVALAALGDKATLGRAMGASSSATVLPQNQQLLRALRISPPSTVGPSTPEVAPKPARPIDPKWREAAVQIRQRTLSLLVELDPGLLVRLDGAWERVVRGGPHCASQAAHSIVEFVDWCLRLAARDDHALRWHAEHKRPAAEIHNGKPTRALRMRYVLRESDPDSEAADIYVRHALDILTLLQGIKHTADDRDRKIVAAAIISLEADLVFLFGGLG